MLLPPLALVVFMGPAAALGASSGCRAVPGSSLAQLDSHTATHLLLSQEKPEYPPIAHVNYIQGKVLLLVTVNCAGRVKKAHVLRGQALLAAAALMAIKKWIYRPFVTRSGPAEFQTLVAVNFDLFTRKFGLLPARPERFLERSVKPPQPPLNPKVTNANDEVHMQVLVNAKGHVIDCTLLAGTPAQFKKARRMVARWKFKPARWGNISVPWYEDLHVPLRGTSPAQGEPETKP